MIKMISVAVFIFGIASVTGSSLESDRFGNFVKEWSEWSKCVAVNGQGQRFKLCTNCPESEMEQRFEYCNPDSCDITKENVMNWCSVVSDDLTSEQKNCLGDNLTEDVQKWTVWTPCSVSCGSGTKSRKLFKQESVLEETKTCMNQPCRPEWTEWSSCSESCDVGSRSRRDVINGVAVANETELCMKIICLPVGCFENKTEYESSGGIWVENIKSEFECQAECQYKNNCKFFIFNRKNKNCYLRSFISGKLPNIDAVSGPRACAVHMGPSHEYCKSMYKEKKEILNCYNKFITVSKSSHEFSKDLYLKLKDKELEANFVMSPLSLASVLKLAMAGAKGNTRNEIKKGLKLTDDNSNDELDSYIKSNSYKGYELSMASRIYLAGRIKTSPTFERISDVKAVRFHRDLNQAIVEINEWVFNETNGKITDIVNEEIITKETRFVLLNVLYFKAEWEKIFTSSMKGRFYVDSRSAVNVTLMRLTDQFRVSTLTELDAKALEMPYKGQKVSMVFILPNNKDGLKNVEEKLVDFDLQNIAFNHPETYDISVPRFRIESTLDLNEPLWNLGMRDMFDADSADFSGLANETNIYVTKVLQKTFIEVYEQGTEAGAATGLSIGSKSYNKVFRCDHPFIFFIKDKGTGQILFMGKVTEPPRFDV